MAFKLKVRTQNIFFGLFLKLLLNLRTFIFPKNCYVYLKLYITVKVPPFLNFASD